MREECVPEKTHKYHATCSSSNFRIQIFQLEDII